MRVAVDGLALQLEMIREDGTVGDDVRMVKPGEIGPRASTPAS